MSSSVHAARLGTILAVLLTLGSSPKTAPPEPASEGPVGPPVWPVSPARDLAPDEADLWFRGRELFAKRWEESEGLAPAFNAESCAACHNAPALGGAGGNDVNVLALNTFGAYYSPQQEIRFTGDVQAQLRELRDGAEPITVARLVPASKGRAASTATLRILELQTPSLFGLAEIDSILESEILKHADPKDRNGDRIRGRVQRVNVRGRWEVSRFGWKARTPRLGDFVCQALGGELGMTAPDQGRGFGQSADKDGVADPELSQEDFDALSFFVHELAPPPSAPRQTDAAQLERGELVFEEVGCAACHVPVLMGTNGPVRLYSDLLLHRVLRAEVNRGRGAAKFRTPPLWGVGDTAPYMHDGRAPTLRDAILLHAGEAIPTRERFKSLTGADQDALIAFVESLPLPSPPAQARAADRPSRLSVSGADRP